MLHWAVMARVAADSCSPAAARSPERLEDLRGLAELQFGTALRVSGQTQRAQDAMTQAQSHLTKGTGDPLLQARLLGHRASLDVYRGKLPDAIGSIDEAIGISEDIGESSWLIHCLIISASARVYGGDPGLAPLMLKRALPLVDPTEEPQLRLVTTHNIARCYIDLGKPKEALKVFQRVTALSATESPSFQLRFAWQEGLLWRELGRPDEAVTALERARKGFSEKKLTYELAGVSRDLIATYRDLFLPDSANRILRETEALISRLSGSSDVLAALSG